MLLEDVAFYAQRSTSFRSLVGGEPAGGVLRDVLIGDGGAITELEVERDGECGAARPPARGFAHKGHRRVATLAAHGGHGPQPRPQCCAPGVTGCSSASSASSARSDTRSTSPSTRLLSRRLHYLLAATCSFVVAVTSNYMLNRLWTFRDRRAGVAAQGMRFFVVSLASLGANLLVLHLLITVGASKFVGQAIAIVLVTPLNFVGNKLWSFRRP